MWCVLWMELSPSHYWILTLLPLDAICITTNCVVIGVCFATFVQKGGNRGLCCHKNSALQFLRSALQEVRPIATLFFEKCCYWLIILPWWHLVALVLIGVATVWCTCNQIEQCCYCLKLLPQSCWVVIFLTTIAIGRPCIATKFLRRCNSLLLLP